MSIVLDDTDIRTFPSLQKVLLNASALSQWILAF